MNNNYRLSIIYFCIFSVMLLLSSIVLFGYKIGFSVESVIEYYLGNEELFIQAKSFGGILETITPHSFAIGLFVMVVSHFILFIKKAKSRLNISIIITLFITLFIEIFSPILIINGYTIFAVLKFVSFIIFEILSLYLVSIVYFSAYKSLYSIK